MHDERLGEATRTRGRMPCPPLMNKGVPDAFVEMMVQGTNPPAAKQCVARARSCSWSKSRKSAERTGNSATSVCPARVWLNMAKARSPAAMPNRISSSLLFIVVFLCARPSLARRIRHERESAKGWGGGGQGDGGEGPRA
ncbi:uncharacterized protein UV8b_02303 [Ustilaginoidea virens]|uniref:Uncharacterized protein n=1 Tax=Ustilaginoidea virens TaxID=1159556 RepID=A0A8E5MFQ3_USTVR|nr:uncharacterized protein UV8b_02303 [Ustilaginoidea virens]QUC18062.1 hypothetical protein UV8b_02303 [Ustilaginoidea virens]